MYVRMHLYIYIGMVMYLASLTVTRSISRSGSQSVLLACNHHGNLYSRRAEAPTHPPTHPDIHYCSNNVNVSQGGRFIYLTRASVVFRLRGNSAV
jgi:hypothetical protein